MMNYLNGLCWSLWYWFQNRLAPRDPSHRKRWAPPSYSAEGGMGFGPNTTRDIAQV